MKNPIYALFITLVCVCFSGCYNTFTISQDAQIDGVLFVIKDDVLYRSFDNGDTLEIVVGLYDNFIEDTRLIITACASSGEAFYVVSRHYLFASYDLGETFQLELGRNWRDSFTDVDVAPDGTVYATLENWGSGSGLWQKRIGKDWNRIRSGGSSLAVDIDSEDSNQLTILEEPGGSNGESWILRSSNAGSSWGAIREVDSIWVRLDYSYQFYQK